MRFLGGLQKAIAVILLLAATAGCTAVAVLNNGDVDVYWTMGILWAVALVVTLIMFGNGHALTQLHKLKKRVEYLEHRMEQPLKQQDILDEEFPEINVHPRTAHRHSNGGAYASPKSSSGKWGWILIAAVVLIAAAVALLLFLPKKPTAAPVPAEPVPTAPSVIYLPESPAVFETEAPSEVAPEIAATNISMGDSAATDFVDIHFQKFVVKEDIKLSVQTGNVTRITGPDPLAGQQYVCLSGKITNKSTSPLPVYDFFTGNFSIDGYNYTVGATDCDILTPDGQMVSSIDPLVEYDFRIYTAIPDVLANSYEACTFTFGFFDGFKNEDLSYIRAFEEDPVSHCPYQYQLIIK